MFAAWTIVEEAAVRAIELIQSVLNIFASMRVYNVQQYVETKAMRLINAFFQFIGVAVAAGSGIKTSDLISETGVVGMLHDGHQLNGIVPLAHNTRQHIFGEIIVRSHLEFLGGDAHMAFVNSQRLWPRWSRMFECVFLEIGITIFT